MAGANQQAFPYLDTPFVDEHQRITIPWYRFLIALWKATGGSIPITSSVYLQQVGTQIVAYNTSTNAPIGVLVTSGTPGGPDSAIAVGASPFVYSPPGSGTVVVYSGQVELTRDAGANWALIGLSGGAVPVLKDDEIRITYTDAGNKPVARWFPDAA